MDGASFSIVMIPGLVKALKTMEEINGTTEGKFTALLFGVDEIRRQMQGRQSTQKRLATELA